MTIQHDCKTRGCYVEKHMPDWAILNECFPRGIKIGDVDGMVEINGFVIWFEWKGKNAQLSNAQRMAFTHASQFAPRQVWIIIWGDKGIPERVAFIKDGWEKRFPADLRTLRNLVWRWACYADFVGSNVVPIRKRML